MKKGWKIALISLGSLIGTIAIVVAVACWLLFTPARLTSIVNKLSDKYLLCENHFGKVSLSLFKTWPDAGLEVEDVVFDASAGRLEVAVGAGAAPRTVKFIVSKQFFFLVRIIHAVPSCP